MMKYIKVTLLLVISLIYTQEGGIFVLNSTWKASEMDTILPGTLKRDLARKKIRFYNIDASTIAEKVGLGRRINTIMQAVFFQLSGYFIRRR